MTHSSFIRPFVSLSETEDADACPCDICRSASIDRDGPRVMAGIEPEPGESLVGLIAAVSAANRLNRLRVLLSTVSTQWHVHYNLAARDDIDFAQLAFACRLPAHEIESRRYPPEEIMTGTNGVRFHGARIPAYDLELRACRFTPSWLRVGVHSALGHHALITHCPTSGELLVDACPRCNAAMRWTRSSFHICDDCGYDVIRHAGETLPRETVEATRPMVELIHPDPARHDPALCRLHDMLRELDRGLVFEIGWRMGCTLTDNKFDGREQAKRLPVRTRLEILTAGSTALETWPSSLTDALRGMAPDASTPSLEIAAAARRLTTSTNAWPGLRQALHDAAPGLKGGSLRAVKATLEQGVNSRELEDVLAVGQTVIERLRGTALKAAATAGRLNSHQIFEGAGLEQLRSLLGDHIAVGKVCEMTGISRHGVEQLACLGEVEIFDAGAVSVAFVQRQVRRTDVERLLRRLAEMSRDIDEDDGTPIRHAMRAIGGREKPWGPVLIAMIEGEIGFSLGEGHTKTLERIRILKSDAPKLIATQFDRAAYRDFSFENTINGRDAEELLNIFPKATPKARKEGSLPKQVDGAYQRHAILELATRYISVSEVLARWNGRNKQLPAPFRGRGSPLIKSGALGWRRDLVEREMAAHQRAE